MPLFDGEDNVGTMPPAQILRLIPKLNVGTIFGLTVTTNEVVVAHWPESGVNVYVPEFWLSTEAGFHFPVIPLVDDEGRVGTLAPAQMLKLVPNANVGVIFGFTVTANDVVVAHCPALGVNV